MSFLSTILLRLNTIFFTFGIRFRLEIKISRAFSVNTFWDKLRVTKSPIKGKIFASPSSVNLFLISFTVFTLDPAKSSQICKATESPSSAFVKSKVYKVSAERDSSIFSYFSGTLIFLTFFFVERILFYEAKLIYRLVCRKVYYEIYVFIF